MVYFYANYNSFLDVHLKTNKLKSVAPYTKKKMLNNAFFI